MAKCDFVKRIQLGRSALLLGTLLAFSILARTAFAQGSETASNSESDSLLTPKETFESNLEFHGFLSQGFAQSTENNFLANSTNGTTKFTEIGFNANKQFTNDLRAGFQLFSRDYGQTGIYRANFDWFLLDYHWHDWLGIRAGRIKLPFGLYNDTSDIDTARVPVLLPQSVYPIQSRDYLLAQTGVEIYGLVNLGRSGGALDYRFYRGTIQLDTTNAANSPVQVLSVNVPYVYGGRLIWETPVPGLRSALSAQKLLLDTSDYLTTSAKTFSADAPISMLVASLEYTRDRFQFVTEYSKWWISEKSSDQSIFPSSGQTSEKYYGMVNYRAKNWLRPGVYYSASFPDENARSSSKDVWNDYAAFVRIDLYSNWLVKFEGHYMDGTAGLNPALNGGTALKDMPRDWMLFLAKTTVSF